MIKCQNCATDNLDGSEYCDECGSRLTVVARVHNSGSGYLPPQPPQPPAFTRDAGTPKPATPYTPPPPPPPVSQPNIQVPPPQSVPPASPMTAVPTQVPPPNVPVASQPPPQSRQGGNKTVALRSPESYMQNIDPNASGVRAKLVIQRGGRLGKEFPIINEDSLIGRWDADGGIFPEVDLDQDDPEAKVSRRHARITIQSGQFFIEDLGSTNGTFVNRGQRLLPGNRHPLNHGDEVIVGKTFLKFSLN